MTRGEHSAPSEIIEYQSNFRENLFQHALICSSQNEQLSYECETSMIATATHLVWGFILSFIGSVPLGAINVTAAETATRKGIRASLIFSFGVVVVECIQVYIAIEFSSWFQLDTTQLVLRLLAILIFFALSYYNFTLVGKPGNQMMGSTIKLPEFLKGGFISSLNVLAIPYWIVNCTFLNSMGWLNKSYNFVLIFCAGVMLGTMFLLWIYARVAMYIIQHMDRVIRWTNLFLASLFFVLGLVQVVKLFL